MISIKKHLDDWDEASTRGRLALEAYLGSLEALDAAVGAMAASEGQQFLNELRAIGAYLRAEPSPDAIKRSRADLERAIRALVEVINQREMEYKHIIRIMAEAGATMVQSGTAHGEELRQIAGKVEAVARLDSIMDVRRQLVVHVNELRTMAVRVQEEGAAKAATLERELRAAREKLRSTAVLAETDALTELGNRRRAENAVQQAIAAVGALSVLMFDLDGFKVVNDTYGHAQGDNLLKVIAHSVRRFLRQSDVVCRWGGDEFVVVMHGANLDVALSMAARLRSEAFGDFVLGRPGESATIRIGASIGAAEHVAGESADELLERADRMMYEDKSRSNKSLAARGSASRLGSGTVSPVLPSGARDAGNGGSRPGH